MPSTLGNSPIFMQNDDDRCEDVAERHERNDDLRNVGDSFYAAKNDEAEYGDNKDRRTELGRTDGAQKRIN